MTSNPPPDTDGDLALQALSRVLTHGPDLLDRAELGRVSSLSADIRTAADGTAWKATFAKAATIASKPFVPHVPSRYCSKPCKSGYCEFVEWIDTRQKVEWGTDQTSVLDCFTAPDQAVLDRVGYARASRCLLSTTCYYCGDLASRANPLTLIRTCKSCAADQEESAALILTTKIAPNFFLDDTEDLEGLPKATVIRPGRSGMASSTVYLLSDIIEAAHAKYGGKDGFLDERGRRLAQKQPTRRNPSRGSGSSSSTSVPAAGNLHKKLKTDACAFDPLVFRCSAMEALPIGTIEDDHLSKWISRKSVICASCDLEGPPGSIRDHEWVVHGEFTDPAWRRREVAFVGKTEEDFSYEHVDALDEPGELKDLLETIKAEYSYEEDIRFQDEEYGATNLSLWKCRFVFKESGSVITIHLRDYSFDYVTHPGVVSSNFVWVSAQVGDVGKPITKLLEMFTDGMQGIEEVAEASGAVFEKVLHALGLQETSPSQLLLSLVMRVAVSRNSWRSLAREFISVGPWTESEKKAVPIYEETAKMIGQILYPRRH